MNLFSEEKNEELTSILDSISSDQNKEKVIEIFLKLCNNLRREPNNETFKKLKKSNKILSNFIYSKPKINKLLHYLGFFEFDFDGGPCFVIFDVDSEKISLVIQKLEEISSIKQQNSLNIITPQSNTPDNSFPFISTNTDNKLGNKESNKEKLDNYKNVIINSSPSMNNYTNNSLNLLKDTANLRKNMIPETPIITQPRDMRSVRFSNMTNQSVVPEYYQSGLNTKPSGKDNLNTADELIGKRCLDLTNEFRKMNNLSPLK
jgi:hypothetical protein